MAIKLSFFLILATFCFQKIESRCGNILSDKEKECAGPLNAQAIWEFYEADSEDPRFVNYLNCTWLKWNYMDESGTILYENLKKSNGLPWQMARRCEDTAPFIAQQQEGFHEAAKFCCNNRPAVETPVTVRRCIVKNYKPKPVHLGTK